MEHSTLEPPELLPLEPPEDEPPPELEPLGDGPPLDDELHAAGPKKMTMGIAHTTRMLGCMF